MPFIYADARLPEHRLGESLDQSLRTWSMRDMKIIPLTGHFGAELLDFSAAKPLDPAELSALRDAFDSGVVVIRGQELRDEEHDQLVESLGELHTFPWGARAEYMSNVITDNPSKYSEVP